TPAQSRRERAPRGLHRRSLVRQRMTTLFNHERETPRSSSNDIRVVLADDHQLFRQGLKALLELERGITIVGEASDGLEVKRMSSKQTPEDGLGQLSETEIKILQHVSAGMSNKEIALKLSLAESTVKNRLSVLFEKIGVLDRTQAAIYAITHGIAPTA